MFSAEKKHSENKKVAVLPTGLTGVTGLKRIRGRTLILSTKKLEKQ